MHHHPTDCRLLPANAAKRIAIAVVLFFVATLALAGGGPENVLLVVNSQSPASLTIANHYVQLRQIPAGNVVFLDWKPDAQYTDIDTFRTQFLLPVLKAIGKRHLDQQIDYVVYSADLPWGVNLEKDAQRFLDQLQQLTPAKTGADGKAGQQAKPQWPKQLTQLGSITGMTYLWQPVMAKHPGYFDLHVNTYMRLPRMSKDEATIAFRSQRAYDQQGKVASSGGRHFVLSTMLAVTAGRGNTVPEVLNYLTRSAAADGTHPKGTIYCVQNADRRSVVRHAGFPDAVRQLKSLGVNAEIVPGSLPINRRDVQGVMMGVETFSWKASDSTILPGAICEHFTSFGGVMCKGASQTPLSEFLRFGAAGASGTVTEPYAIAEKFPSPMIQVHYARGCSLAEAFYQSVYGPYQLLIVGDPLCRPWAVIPQVSVAGMKPGEPVRGRVEIKPSATVGPSGSLPSQASVGQVANLPAQDAADHFELFVEGVRRAACKPGGSLTLDTLELADGYHELRVVAVGPRPIESQGRQIMSIRVANHGREIPTVRFADTSPKADKPLVVEVRSPGSTKIILVSDGRILGEAAGEQGKITIPAKKLGAGPVRLQAIGLGDGGSATIVFAEPLNVTLE